MKRIALTIAALGLSAGAAFAASPNSSAMTQPSQQPSQQAQMQRSGWQANQETKALNVLEAQGFASFSNFRPVGNDHYAANVIQHGRDTTVQIDPQDGQITRG